MIRYIYLLPWIDPSCFAKTPGIPDKKTSLAYIIIIKERRFSLGCTALSVQAKTFFRGD
jgi:hypothetical protein